MEVRAGMSANCKQVIKSNKKLIAVSQYVSSDSSWNFKIIGEITAKFTVLIVMDPLSSFLLSNQIETNGMILNYLKHRKSNLIWKVEQDRISS